MDIYKVDEKEGRSIAQSLEHLRCKKKRGKIAVKCGKVNNNQVKRFRSNFLLENGTSAVLNEATGYYIIIDDTSLALNITFSECDVIYSIGERNGWKIIDLEIDDREFRNDTVENMNKTVGRADALAFYTIFQYAYTYGYANVFSIDKSKKLYDTISSIIIQNDISENDFGIDNKIINLISQNTMKKEFVEYFSS